MKSNSLKVNIWLYLILFTFFIILFLWFFQVVFIGSYYEYSKTKQIKRTAHQISLEGGIINQSKLDTLSFQNDVCIEVVNNYSTIYSSNSFNKGCILENYEYKTNFYMSLENSKTYRLINPRFDNKTLVYALKLDSNTFVFVNASLEPLKTTVSILSGQLVIVSMIVVVLALLVGYFISKKISKPIEKMNQQASLLANGNYNFTFDSSSITEINELATTLNYTKDELAHTEEIRRDLLANVSHDLKTPLTMMKGYAEMVRDLTYKDKKKREENLNVIIEEADRLNGLVEDILTLSKVQANHDILKIESFDLINMIKNILKRYDILKEEGYEFICKMPDSLLITADKKKLEQVVYNLINNAINYTGNDQKVYITVAVGDEIVVSIQDTGKGIDSKDIQHIWEKYYHSQKKHQRNKVGTGLGLSIVKTVLESHQFKYGVESKKGKGTIFYFRIPK